MANKTFNTRISDTLAVSVYGPHCAVTLGDKMAQGYAVWRHNKATPRSELTQAERDEVQAYLDRNWPEHATL